MENADLSRIRFDASGLVPAIVQDLGTGRVLMLAYMNRESLQQTLDSGECWFWSRSRQKLWHKGEESGHHQRVCEILVDCDGDTLLVRVEPAGPACHTGNQSCFFRSLENGTLSAVNRAEVPENLWQLFGTLARLHGVIADRRRQRPIGSYTSYLFDKGLDKILKKVGEETAEVLIAAKNADPRPLAEEMADLLYHLLVLAHERGISPADVAAVLEERHRIRQERQKEGKG